MLQHGLAAAQFDHMASCQVSGVLAHGSDGCLSTYVALVIFLNSLAIVYIGYASAKKRYELNFIDFVIEMFV